MKNPISQLAMELAQHKPVLVLSGAGISTGSGIPAYRNADGEWIHPRPVLAAQFKANDHIRRRYWRRSMSGWPTFNSAVPNDAHRALTQLQAANVVSSIITQNVDGLHQKAGSTNVIELHGALGRVTCLDCNHHIDRARLQEDLLAMNPRFNNESYTIAADGDAVPANHTLADQDFSYPDCSVCGGMLKPAVVFFGENVPKKTVLAGQEALTTAGCLLCVGTSLSVLSGFRYCRGASAQKKPVYIINQGSTRADDMTSLKIDFDCADVLENLVTQLCV